MTNAEGCPVAVEVYAGNTSDPKTVSDQVTKLRIRFGLQRVILVGNRGMITSARIRENLQSAPGIEWITALRAPAIKKLASDGVLQLSLFDSRDLAEITHPDFPGERLIACYNPLLAEERARKRPELLAATEKELEKIAAATRRKKRPLRGKQNIGLRAGKVLDRYKMGKHFQIQIEDDSFSYQRKQTNIEKEESLDGIYVIRTNVPRGSILQRASRAQLQKSVWRGARFPQFENRGSAGAPHPPSRAGSRARTCLARACWRTTWSGICARIWLPFCSTMTTKTPRRNCAPRWWRRQSVRPPLNQDPQQAHSRRSTRAQFSNSAERFGHHRHQPRPTEGCHHPGIRHHHHPYRSPATRPRPPPGTPQAPQRVVRKRTPHFQSTTNYSTACAKSWLELRTKRSQNER